jgi:7-cyano-7-deazaguanine synthase
MAVILLSGGLDSALNLALAARDNQARLAITIRYGQRAEDAELNAARKLSDYYGVNWVSVDLSWLGGINTTGLTRSATVLPTPKVGELDDLEIGKASAKAVWVANRNGVFLNVAAAYAEAMDIKTILAGFNREEAATFPDNSVAFLAALNHSFSYSTMNHVTVDCFTKDLDKTQIIAQSLELNLPLHLVWSCYEAGPKRCWQCESCKRTERALLAAGRAGEDWLGRMDYTR